MTTELKSSDPALQSVADGAYPKGFFVLLILVILSRIPFLLIGFGADGDAWRIADTAVRLWNEGTYAISRAPGFPVYELISAPLIGLGGSFISNAATLLVFLISLLVLKRILELWQVPSPILPLASFAFFPLLWKNSAITLDYAWGLAGLLITLLYFLKRKYVVAGIFLGIAAGTRITHIVYIIPFLLLVQPDERSAWRVFALSAVVTTIASYIPVLVSPSSLSALAEYNSGTWQQPLWKIIATGVYRFIYSAGLLGILGLAGVAIAQQKQISNLRSHLPFAFCVACISLAIFMFTLLPDEREYLIPAIPFLLVAAFLSAKRRQIIIVTAFLLSYSFVSIDVVEHNTASPSLKVAIRAGIVIEEFTNRLENDRVRKHIASLELPDSSMVMVGSGPAFGLENPHVEPHREFSDLLRQDVYKAKRGNLYYVYSLDAQQLQEMRGRGFRIYYTENVGNYLESFIGYRLADEGVAMLKIDIDKRE